jgi:hypothetical protein
MANGQATINFEGVNLDPCIKQGLELFGTAKCPNCKQTYAFQIKLNLRQQAEKYTDVLINGETVTIPVPESYEVSINFSDPRTLTEAVPPSPEPENQEEDGPCVPCSRCTPNCEKLGGRF